MPGQEWCTIASGLPQSTKMTSGLEGRHGEGEVRYFHLPGAMQSCSVINLLSVPLINNY